MGNGNFYIAECETPPFQQEQSKSCVSFTHCINFRFFVWAIFCISFFVSIFMIYLVMLSALSVTCYRNKLYKCKLIIIVIIIIIIIITIFIIIVVIIILYSATSKSITKHSIHSDIILLGYLLSKAKPLEILSCTYRGLNSAVICLMINSIASDVSNLT